MEGEPSRYGQKKKPDQPSEGEGITLPDITRLQSVLAEQEKSLNNLIKLLGGAFSLLSQVEIDAKLVELEFRGTKEGIREKLKPKTREKIQDIHQKIEEQIQKAEELIGSLCGENNESLSLLKGRLELQKNILDL